jgi:hypothetical protein
VTESERLFESYCAFVGLIANRIEADGSSRRPDFGVVGHDGTPFIVEVKQFDPNAEELQAEADRKAGKARVTGGEPGARLRDAISDANQQIKSLGRSEVAGILLVYRHPAASRQHTDPYAVLTAMRGLDVVPVIVPVNPREPSQFLPTRVGPKGRLTPHMNRSISAIAVLRDRERGDVVSLDVFHNPVARVELPLQAIATPSAFHFSMSSDRSRWHLRGAV